ncbi:glycosyltransferase family 25 protein [Acidipropionibacterium timonense]|uniref:glycosyltransferase family 25 protein n=1 Tax=Acidipropionibacterium timonense TaxID=2161818 RepID=UPI0014366F42
MRHEHRDRIVRRAVISLEGSPRRETFFSQPYAAGFEVWDAFDGRTGAGQDRFDVQAFQRRYGRAPLGGEIGCTLSHADLMASFGAEVGRDDDLMLVAEDDVVFPPYAGQVISGASHATRAGLILLGSSDEDWRNPNVWARSKDAAQASFLSSPVAWVRGRGLYRVGPYHGSVWGTTLYLVNRGAARDVAQFARIHVASWLADDFATWHQAAGVEIHWLRPTVSGWDGQSELDPGASRGGAPAGYSARSWGRPAWNRRWRRFKGGASATVEHVRSLVG